MKQVFIIWFMAGLSNIGIAQNVEWLAVAKDFYNNQNFEAADEILSREAATKHNFYALWLHAQVKYALNKIKKADALYQQAISLNHDDKEILLDYGNFLLNNGNIVASRKILMEYNEYNPSNLKATALLAQADLWEGKMKSANQRISELDNKNYDPQEVLYLKAYFDYLRKFRGEGTLYLYIDDQVVEYIGSNISGNIYINRYFKPYAKVDARQFEARRNPFTENNSSLLTAQIGNTSFISRTKTHVTLGYGLFMSDFKNFNTWHLTISQTLTKRIKAEASYNTNPYLYTAIGVSQPFIYAEKRFDIAYEQKEKTYSKSGFIHWQFSEMGSVSTAYTYWLQSVYSQKYFRFFLGYSLNYSSSSINRFRPIDDVNEFTPVNEPLPGVFDPFFSPQNQWVNSALCKLKIQFKKISFDTQFSYGFYAFADNPTIFADVDNNGNYTSTKEFYTLYYHPIEVNLTLGYGQKNNERIFFVYDFRSLFFFTAHQFGFKIPLI